MSMARGINAPQDPELSELSRHVQPEKVMEPMEAHERAGDTEAQTRTGSSLM
jgi:hypothetical protein